MATTSDEHFHYFNFHIVATFAEYLNDVKQHCYEKLTDDWWNDCFHHFSPLIFDDTQKIDDTQKAVFDKVMNEFSKELLTEAQKKELNEFLGEAIIAYKDRFTIRCHCKIIGCDGDCGVQSCGRCIDCCRCPMYW